MYIHIVRFKAAVEKQKAGRKRILSKPRLPTVREHLCQACVLIANMPTEEKVTKVTWPLVGQKWLLQPTREAWEV